MKPKTPNEAQVTKRFKAYVELRKKDLPHLYCLKMSDRYHSGIPDFMLICDKQVGFVELKAPGKKLTKIQLHVAGQLTKAGAMYEVCTIENDQLVFTDLKGKKKYV